ncbi:MAG TPA: hypothetical protein DFS52_31425 [Myxococcales bacterium]|jgi:hypothetical protein|nr:hypothetical protein [Myxococcales bacterium]
MTASKAGRPAPSEKNPLKMAGEIANAVELDSVALRAWSAEFLGGGMAPPSLKGRNEVSAAHSARFDYDQERGLLDVLVSFEVIAREAAKEGRERVKIRCDLALRYSFKSSPDLSEEHLKHFANLNGVVNAWPYLRETVHATTNRMGLPPLVLPLFRVSNPAGTKRQAAGAS